MLPRRRSRRTTVLSPITTIRSVGRIRRDGPSFPAQCRAISWGFSRQKRCPCFPVSPAATLFATTGSVPFPPRRCPTAPSPVRPRPKVTWTTRQVRTRAPAFFGLLLKHKISWAIYGYETDPLTRQNFTDTTNAPDTHFGVFTDFTTAAAGGKLPAFTFLEPSWGATGNSQHPNNNVTFGKDLIYKIYYALRNGPAWNNTLLIITY